MIPKIIHYCWFGKNAKPPLAEKCIKSWKKYCPDYQLIEWNEDNFDLSACPLYVRQAYEAKKWAFLTDYIRLKVVYDHGGIYFDTDVELLKSPDSLMSHRAWFGFQDGKCVATGLGFGAEANHSILAELMAQYADIPFFLPDGTMDLMACPERNTEVFLNCGLKQDDSRQILEDDILILPTVVLCPLDYFTGKYKRSRKTISVHRFAATWRSKEDKKRVLSQRKQWRRQTRKDKRSVMIRRIAMKLLGETRYQSLKKRKENKR